MPSKSVTLSVRITDEDAKFLAGMSISGALTPSEKIRAILARERRRQTGTQEFAKCAAFLEEMLAPAIERLREIRSDTDLYSNFSSRLYDTIPILLATLVVRAPRPGDPQESLEEFEHELATQVFDLIEDIIQLAMPNRNRGFDALYVDERLSTVLQLSELVKSMKSQAPITTEGETK